MRRASIELLIVTDFAMVENPFCGPLMKVGRANTHIAELAAIVDAYSKRVKYGFKESPEDSTDEMIGLRLHFSERPPKEIPLLIGDAVHNLRGALDLLVCDVARLRGKSTGKIKFPFAEDADKLEEKLKGDIKRIGNDFIDIIRDLKPFKGGNVALRGLHDLDIMDKHEMVLPVFHVTAFHSPGFSISGFKFEAPGLGLPMPPGTLFHVRRNSRVTFTFQQEGGPYATIPHPLPFAGENLVVMLENLSKLVTQIIEAFARSLGGRESALGNPS